ncbi:diacylglycerol/lipid kinase family protein [Spirochaeta lutea]|uniref:DAGKc domain-containing protein n=1 Tax=Spirochaeta lutea TaxID=1480694 RepID=A0A098R2D8_9SPIO|nr:YegS/Rv2252/BmrU family lipid kinase [Spirochaeta lutea]KGE73956.1 hypothetical protein DC28_01930 [Spirochaeta lutea]
MIRKNADKPATLLCIINPAAGRRRWLTLTMHRLTAYAEQHNITLQIEYTRHRGDGGRIIQSYREGKDAVVVLGGDGTVREVVEGMIDNPLPILIIPHGTANVLSKELFIPQDPVKALSLWRTGRIKHIDLGMINEHPFVLMVSSGIDALTVHSVYKAEKKFFGKFAYVLAVLRTLTRRKPPLTTLEIYDDDLQKVVVSGYQVIISNGKYYAGRIVINPTASLNSGYLHVMVYKQPGIGALITMMFNVLSGQSQHLKDLHQYKAKQVVIKTRRRRFLQFDGDRLDEKGGTVQVLASRLPVVVQ